MFQVKEVMQSKSALIPLRVRPYLHGSDKADLFYFSINIGTVIK